MQCPYIVTGMSANTRSVRGEQLEFFCPVLRNAGLDDPTETVIQRSLECGWSQRPGPERSCLLPLLSPCDYHHEPHFINCKISRILPASQGDWTFKLHAMWESTL